MTDVKNIDVPTSFLHNNGLFKLFQNTYTAFSQRREALKLWNPGPIDKIKHEVDTDVFLTKFMFTGLKGDFNRPLSMSPMFQYSHSFALGSQQLPPYGFSALYGVPGSVGSNLSVNGRTFELITCRS